MAYPEKLLADDEEIVEHLHPHWITLVAPVSLFILICALSGVAIAFLPAERQHHTAHQGLLLTVLVVAALLILWLVVAPVVRWRSNHYVITTHRVLIRRGVLKHVGRDITLARINDVAYEQSIWDRIVRAGSLTIESAGEQGQETLIDIPHANEVQQTLNRLIEADSMRRARGEHYRQQGGDGNRGGRSGYGGQGGQGGQGGHGDSGGYRGYGDSGYRGRGRDY